MPGLLQPQGAEQPMSEQPPAQQAVPQQPPPEQQPANDEPDESIDESHPKFQAAMKLAYQSLYGKKGADNVANVLTKANDLPEALANTAYEMTSIIDERIGIPDELLVLLASHVLEEVADIGETAQVVITPADIATAFKAMLLRFLGEQGVDTSQLQQAMDSYSPEDFNTLAQQEMNGETEQPQPEAMTQ